MPEFFEALREGSRSTRIEDASDHLIAVVNDVAYEFSFEPSEIASLWMTVSARVAVSDSQHGFRIVVLIVLTFTVVAGWIAFRRRD